MKEILIKLKQKRLFIPLGTLSIILISMIIANIGGIGTYIADAAAPVQSVFVTNTQTSPIPISGNVGIIGNVAIKEPVGIIGNVSVKEPVNVIGNVAVSGTPIPIQDVDNARQPFVENLHIGMSAGNDSAKSNFTVPTGKRLVIEFVSIRAFAPSGQKMLFDFDAITNNIGAGYYLAPSVDTFKASNILIANQQMRVYVDPDTNVDLQVFRDYSDLTAQVDATFSGYLINVTS